jgi:hypothetical protein
MTRCSPKLASAKCAERVPRKPQEEICSPIRPGVTDRSKHAEAEVSDAHEAVRKQVQKEAT